MIRIEANPAEIYDIELEHSLLEANDKLAQKNRADLDKHGITAIDFMGAIGSGKTTLITRLVEKLKDKVGVAVFNGDATTSSDGDPIAAMGVPIVQIATINGCHLDANVVAKACAQIDLNKVELAGIMEVSVEKLIEDVHKLKPDLRVIPTSCKTGAGLDDVAMAILAI